MGTIIGISDLDPLRWPGSKWRNLQVEWDEPGCKPKRVSSWEIETPESIFIFHSLTSGLKRPFYFGILGAETDWGNSKTRPLAYPEYSPISSLCSEQLFKMMLKPQLVNNPGTFSSSLQQTSDAKGAPLEEVKTLPATTNQKAQLLHPENARIDNQNCSRICLDQADTVNSSSSKINIPEKLNPPSKCEKKTQAGTITDNLKSESTESTEQLSNLTTANCSVENLSVSLDPKNLVNQLTFHNQNQGLMQLQTSGWPMQPQLEAAIFPVQQIHALQSDSVALNGLLPVLDTDEWISHACNSITGMYSRSPGPKPIFGLQEPSTMLPQVINPTLSLPDQVIWDHRLSNLRLSPQVNPLTSFTQQDHSGLNSSGLRDFSDESNTYSCLNVDVSTGGKNMIDHSVSSAILDEFCTLKDDNFQNPPVCLMNTLSSSQDVQSHSLADSQALSRQIFPDNSGGTSSSNVDFDESSLLQNTSWQPVVPPVRTYTKGIRGLCELHQDSLTSRSSADE